MSLPLKPDTATLQISNIDEEITTLATCWHITLCNGKQIGFTDHHDDIFVNNMLYVANAGFYASTISTSIGLAVDNLDITGVLQTNLITEDDILAGHYNNAEVRVFIANYTNPASDIIKLRMGWIGEIKLDNGKFVAEIRGLMEAFNANIGRKYSPHCNATFGDEMCKIDISKYTFKKLTVDGVTNRSQFICNRLPEIMSSAKNVAMTRKIMSMGRIEFTSGCAKGLAASIANIREEHIQITLVSRHNISVGDEFNMLGGCNKMLGMCSATYNNAVNFRGFPRPAYNIGKT